MPLLVLVVNKKFGVQVTDGDSYVAGMAVFVFGVALVAALLAGTSLREATRQDASETGVVKWFNSSKGFGFITLDGGNDVFVHYRDILGHGHRSLSAGQKVAFKIANNRKGPHAQDVTVLS